MNQEKDLLGDLGVPERRRETGPAVIDAEAIKAMVHNKLGSATPERRKRPMLKSKKLRTVLIAAIAVMALSVSAFAATGIITRWDSHSWARPEYDTLPTVEQTIKDVGYAAKLIEEFSNGYAFQAGSIVDNDLVDEGGHSAESFKSFNFTYAKDGDEVWFSQDKYDSDLGEASGDVAATVDGIDVMYFSYNNKLVPPDYKLSDEDKAAEEAGELIFSYGSDEVTTQVVQCVFWQEDDVHYSLTQMDGALSAEELVAMAAEVIQG